MNLLLHKITIPLVVAFILSMSFSSCNFVTGRLSFRNCSFHLEQIQIKRFPSALKGLSALSSPVSALLKIRAQNPNAITVYLDRLLLKIYLNDSFLAKTEHQSSIRIPPKKSMVFSVMIDTSIKSLSLTLVKLLQAPNRVRYLVRGKAYVQTPISRNPITIPISLRGTLDTFGRKKT